MDLALTGTLEKGTIKNKESALLQAKAKVSEELDENREKFRAMPDLTQVKQEADTIRRELLEHFSGEDRLSVMSFNDKKRLLHWLFDGKDAEGKPYGIYISKRGKDKWDYFLYGRITGLRTLKGEDFNYQAWDEDEKVYKTNNGGLG